MKIKIETERLLLRHIIEEDTQDTFEYCRNSDVGSHAGWKPHADLAETRKIMKEVFLNKENVWGIVLKENNKMVGSIGLIPDPKRQYDKVLMLGYALARECWGRGLMTEAAQAVAVCGFEVLHLEGISAYCFPYNKRSGRILEKCGFASEGILKKAELRYDGVLLDNECWFLSRECWQSSEQTKKAGDVKITVDKSGFAAEKKLDIPDFLE